LQHAEDLTIRTNQLNNICCIYAYDELHPFRQSSSHLLLVDNTKDYIVRTVRSTCLWLKRNRLSGKLNFCWCPDTWCHVALAQSRCIIHGQKEGVQHSVEAEFISNGCNRMMLLT
jgi:hypothetical protein